MGSPVDRLVKAVNWLEKTLARLSEEARKLSTELVKAGDEAATSLRSEVEGLARASVEEIRRFLAKASREIEAEYTKLIEDRLREAEERARERMDAAVKAVLEEIKRALREA